MKRRLRSTSSLVSQGQGTSTDPSEEKKEMHPGQKDEIKHTDSKGQMGSPDKDYYGKQHELKGREKRVRNKMRAKPHWHSQDKYSNIPQSKLVEGKGLKVGFNTTDPLMHVCDDDAKPHKLRRRERTVKGKTGDIDSGNYRGNLQDLPLSYYSSGPLLFPDWLHNIPLYKSATPTTAATQLVDNWLDKDYLEEEHMLKETEKKTGGEIREPQIDYPGRNYDGKQHELKGREKNTGANTDVATSTMLQDLSALPDHSKPDLWVSSQSPSCINDSPQLSFGRAQPLMSSQSKGDEGKQLKFKRRRAQPLMGSQSKDDEGKQHELKGREKAGTLVPPIELDNHFKYFDGKQHKFKRRKKTETTVANTDVATSTMLQDLSVLPDHRKPDLWVSSQSPSCINDSPQLSLGRAQPLMSSQSKDDEGKQHEPKGRKKAGTRLLSIHFLDPLNPSVGPWTVRQPITGTHLPPKDEGKRTGSGLSSVQSETMSGGSGEFPGETDTLLTILTKPKNLCTKAQKVFTPDFTEDFDDEAYMFQCSSPGLYQCSVSGLVFHMEGEGEVLYRIVPWNRRLLRQHHKKPAGPLFDIKCLQQSVCQLHLPHCEILSTGGSNFLSVAHITDDGIEFISPHKITETHVIINITGFSGFGNVKDEDSPPDPVNALVLLFYKLPDNHGVRSLLNVLLVPRNIVIRDLQRTRRKLIGDERYIDASPHCRLQPKQVYSLSTDLGSELVKVQPTEAEFDEESHNSYFTSFQVILKNIISVINLRVENTSSSCCAWEREVCLFPSTVAAPNVRPVDRMLTIRRSFIEGISGAVLQSLVDKLLETKVITDSEREAAEENRSRRDKAQYVFDTVRRKGDAASSKMIEFLREADPFFCDHVGLT